MFETEQHERNARAYCRSIGADPDEWVEGVDELRFGTRERMSCPRWRWYVGASAPRLQAEG
jgi:hypothetical protein